MQLLSQNNIDVFPLPAPSPDLSPIEHLWEELYRRVRRHQPPPQSTQQLRKVLLEEWNNILQGFIQRFIGSMSRGLQWSMQREDRHVIWLVISD